MANEFTLDRSALDRALRQSPQAANRGAATALKDIKNDWVADAVDVAPIKTGNLRRQINGEVINPGASGRIEVAVPAVRGGFNYAYYIHEEDAGGKQVNGEKKFLEKPAEAKLDEWQQWLEEEVARELRRVGW